MKKKKRTLAQQNARAGLLYSLPFIIGFVCFTLFPLIQSILLSFHTVSASANGMVMRFEGWGNYHRLLFENSSYVRHLLLPSLKELAINFPCILIFSFFIAVMLNQQFRGRTFFRVIFFLPVVVSSGVILLVQDNQLQTNMLSGITGSASGGGGISQFTDTVTDLLEDFAVGEWLITFVTSAVDRIYDIVTSSGIQILIYLAGLQTISPSLYEASSIEGATGWENFWKITFPMISPMILVNAVYTIVDIMGGLNNNLVKQIYNTSFVIGDYGYGSAMGWIYFLIIGLVLLLFLGVASCMVYYEDR